MKKTIKALCVLVSALTALSAFSSCKKNNGKNEGDNAMKYEKTYLLKDGKSNLEIVLPSDSSDSEQYAARELNRIFEGTAGITLPIKSDSEAVSGNYISIGRTTFAAAAGIPENADTGFGGYVLKTSDGNLFIDSKTESGKINGVYGFAEENLGYRYYASDEIRYGKGGDVKLRTFDEVKKPSFDGRNVFSYETVYDHENAVRLRCNGITSNWSSSYGEASLWSTLHDMSNVFQLLYVKDYYPEHPDWFYVADEYAARKDEFASMSDSEFYEIAQKKSQICYTKGYYDKEKGGMFDTYVDNLIRYIQNEPDRELFMLGMGDNEYVCDCADCTRDIAEYKMSGVVMRFTNRVAKRIKEWLKNESGTPDRKIYLVVFAYLTAMEPPVKYVDRKPVPIDDSVVAEDNVMIRIAPLVDSNFYWQIDDSEHNAFMANNINGWKQISSNYSIWDYRLYFHYLFVPYPVWNTIKSNLTVYKNLNVIDVYHQGYAETPVPFGKLDDYVRARLLYDLDENAEELTDDFIDNYYKQAASYIREYRDLLKYHYEINIVPKRYSGSVYSDMMKTDYWPIEILMKIRDVFDNAYESLEGLPADEYEILKQRVDEESRFYRYALLELYGEKLPKKSVADLLAGFKAANAVRPFTYHAVREPITEKISAWENLLK